MLQATKKVKTVIALSMVFALVAMVGCSGDQTQMATDKSSTGNKKGQVSWNFDDVTVGKLPASWKIEATNQKGPLATWQVIKETAAPSGDHILALTSVNHTSSRTFNLCWTDSVSFLDGKIEVRFKAIKGKVDQGGGVIWRAQDKNNYYIARFNPLENNFRIYYVRDSVRKQIADTEIELPEGKWHTLKIIQRGNHYEGYLNGKKLLDGTDDQFTKPGGVGLWTKADAVTSFDGFAVKIDTAQ